MSTLPHSFEDKAAPWVALALAGLTALVFFVARQPGGAVASIPELEFAQSRLLVFADVAEGGIVVSDASTGVEVAQLGTGDGGFTRTALRALFYSRRLHEVGPLEPVLLARATDGRVILHDPSTDKTIALDAFGDPNAAQVAALLDTEVAAP